MTIRHSSATRETGVSPQGNPAEPAAAPAVLLPLAIIAAALAGLFSALAVVSVNSFRLVSHLAVPFEARTWPVIAVVCGHALWWYAAWRVGGLTLAELARAVVPLAGLCLFSVLLLLNVGVGGYIVLYLLLALVAWTGMRVTQCWRGPPLPALSSRTAWSLAVVLCLAYIGYTAWYQWTRYEQMLLGYSDVGYYVKRLQNTFRHGAFLRHLSDLPTFWDHFCPGLAILLPVAWVVPPLITLILAQSVFWGGTGLLLMWLARRQGLAPLPALAIATCWFLNPGVTQMTYCYSYGFHPPTLALPFLLLSAYYLDTGQYRWAVLPGLLAMSMQEHISIYFAGFGVMLFLTGRRRAGVVCSLLGTAVFLTIFTVFFPWHAGGESVHVGQFFGHLGNNLFEIALSPALRPHVFWGSLLSWHNLHLLLQLGLPLAGACLLAPRYIVALGLIFLFNFLRIDLLAKSTAFQYQTGTTGLLFLAMVMGLSATARPEARWYGLRWFMARLGGWKRSSWLCGAMAATLMASLYLALLPWSKKNLGILPEPEQIELNAAAFHELQALIPADATVTCDDRTRMLFTDRRLDLDFKQAPYYETNYHVYRAGAWRTDPAETRLRVEKLIATGEWELIFNKYNVVALRRRHLLPPPPDNVF